MYHYKFNNPQIQKLVQAAVSNQWDVYRQLPWNHEVNLESVFGPGHFSLLEATPEFKHMGKEQQNQVRIKEVAYHLSNLLGGEHKAMILCAQIMDQCPQDIPDWNYFVSTILNDERNHALALSRYLYEKIGSCYQPHPRIQSILNALIEESSYEIKLFIAQVVLEWTATFLLASLVLRSPEPLMEKIVKRILADEGRHLIFSKITAQSMVSERKKFLNRSFEDLIFEGIVACISSLFAIPVWQEYGFSSQSCREYTFHEMQAKGIFKFYKTFLPKELAKYGLYTDRLEQLLSNELEQKVIQDHLSFEPCSKNGDYCELLKTAN